MRISDEILQNLVDGKFANNIDYYASAINSGYAEKTVKVYNGEVNLVAVITDAGLEISEFRNIKKTEKEATNRIWVCGDHYISAPSKDSAQAIYESVVGIEIPDDECEALPDEELITVSDSRIITGHVSTMSASEWSSTVTGLIGCI